MRHTIFFASTAILLAGGALLAIEVSSAPAAVEAAPPHTPEPSLQNSDSPTPQITTTHKTVITPNTPSSPPTANSSTPPPQPRSAVQRRDTLRAQIRGSGTAPTTLVTSAENVLADWRRAAPAGLAQRVELGPFECHAGGCFVEAVYPDQLAFEQVDESIVASPAFQNYPGWRHRAGPIDDGTGKIKATWFFMPQ